MSDNSIRNIIFDLGNVLLDIDYSLTAQKLSAITGLDINRDLMEHGGVFNKFETGKIPYIVFFNYLTRISRKKAVINDMLPAWNAMLLDIRPEIRALLERLSDKYRLYLLSNTNEVHLQWLDRYLAENWSKEAWYRKIFTKTYYSHLIGYRKPDAACFEFVLNDAGLLPGETLFIDDVAENIAGARSAGIQAYRFDRSKWPLDRFLREKAGIPV